MAVDGEESDYESDPEEALRPSVMRRREASDDEDGEGSDAGERLTRRTVGSDGESDCQGGAPVYEDDDEGEFGSEEEEELGRVGEEAALEDDANGVVEEGITSAVTVLETSGEALEYRESDQVEGEDGEEGEVEGGEEEKKASEPFAVPKAGAFYMHDDRFQENGRGRHRRMYGGRKLWESKDERAWVHDRFEEMNLQDDRYDEEKRMSRGRFRGRGNRRTRGMGRGYVREKKPQAYNDSNNQNQASRTVRGRGPRRYETLLKSDSGNHKIQYKQAAKPQEQTVKTGSVRQMLHSANRQSEPIIPNRQVFASSLSSASPPFYPSGSSSQDIPISHKREAQLGTSSKALSSPMQLHENFSATQHGSIPRGKATMESSNNDKLYMDDSIRLGGKTLANSHLSGSSLPLISASQSSHSVVQGRGLTINTPPNKHPTSSINQVARVATQAQSIVLQRPGSTSDQLALRVSTQQLGSRSSNGSQSSSISQTVSTLSEAGETDSPPGASKSKTALVTKGKASNQATERGSLVYNGGTQVIGASGAMGLVHGDQGFPATPALLPVMQFGGQHHNGIPAVGMALPGYVARPQLGFGNSEMTWVPLLAGASGALGASYGSPYIALDSSYFTRSSGQSSSVTSRRESSVNKPADTWKQPEGSETASDEYGQRQKNKPRRYSEMSFGQ
ncbi:hypothetical protein J5N97_003955 [Dioscorea zingiberensis]|uniref:Btz domain-containing protein n=1 Tax=Dioscorea zingiberensis TaxID=325984 RepID=A0A9D5D6V4_9LILI|nr:hypothetical protein J5N97_003955 [Dioscorea zingiberensis]